MSKQQATISVITSAFNEAECIPELVRRLRAVFDTLPGYDFELIAVENGSSDETFERLLEERDADERIRVVQLARNFRMDGGLTAGLDYATGDAVVLMAADLQDRPEDIPAFIEQWEKGYENVYGIVTVRRGTSLLRRFNSRAFYFVLGHLSDTDIPKNASDFRLLDRKVYEQVRQMDERNRFVRGLVAWVGFRSIGVPIERPERFAGSSKAPSLQVFELALRGLFGHSMRPILFMPLVGFGLFLASLAALVALCLDWCIAGVPFPGFGTIIAVTVMLFGVLFCFLGVLGFYVGLVYEEVRGRPNYVTRHAIGFAPPSVVATLRPAPGTSSGTHLSRASAKELAEHERADEDVEVRPALADPGPS